MTDAQNKEKTKVAPTTDPKLNKVKPDSPAKAASDKSKKDASAVQPRSKQQKQESFNFIKGYAKRECCSLILGCIFLLGGNLIEFTIPLFLGKTIDLMQAGDFDAVGTLCLYMIIVTIVSNLDSFMKRDVLMTGCWHMHRFPRRHFQYSK